MGRIGQLLLFSTDRDTDEKCQRTNLRRQELEKQHRGSFFVLVCFFGGLSLPVSNPRTPVFTHTHSARDVAGCHGGSGLARERSPFHVRSG